MSAHPSPPLQLFYKNGQPFPAHRPVGLRVHISHVELAVDIPVTQEVLQEPNSNVMKVAFTVRKAGRYEITVKLGGLNVAYSPYYKIFQPGMVVPSKTKIVCHFSTLVLTCEQPHTLQIVPRDEYDNPTNNSMSLRDEHNYSLAIHEVSAAVSSLARTVRLSWDPHSHLFSLTSEPSWLYLVAPVPLGSVRHRLMEPEGSSL